MVDTFARKPEGHNTAKRRKVSDIIAGAVQWHGRNTSQPIDTSWKRTWAKLKKRKPIPKQCPARRRDGMERMKAQRLIHATRVKRALECVVKSDKPRGIGKHVRARKATNSYRSGACTQGSGTTYLYPTNIGEVGHGLEVWEGVVWRWGEGGAYFGVPAQALSGEMSC